MDLAYVMKEYGTYLYKIAYLYVKNHETAEEIVQDVFVDYHFKQQFEERASLKTYLVKMTIYKSQNELRSFRALKRQVKHFAETYMTKDVDVAVEQKLENERMIDALFQLPIKYREVLIFYYYESYTTREISQLLLLSENTVKTRLARGRTLLKTKLPITKGGIEDGFMEKSN
jgi:RNA polymerase sigma factor (sigma-70 family)